MIQCAQLSDDLDEGLYRLINHIAHGDTLPPVTADSSQPQQDQYAWWSVLYLLPRWLLWSLPDEVESIGHTVEVRCARFMRFDWAALHSASARSWSSGPPDEGNPDDISVPLPQISPVDRANMLVAVGELRRAGLALDLETHDYQIILRVTRCERRGCVDHVLTASA